jgi:hypothetical protein
MRLFWQSKTPEAPSNRAPDSTGPAPFKLPPGARSNDPQDLNAAVGGGAVDIAFSNEIVLRPAAAPGAFELHSADKGAFDVSMFGPAVKVDSDYWPNVVTSALQRGAAVWSVEADGAANYCFVRVLEKQS